MTAFTPEQQAAIGQRQGPLLLSANAGSGKTTVLVERLVAAVLEDGIAPARLLAITFTDKAAGELRSRVRARLAAAGQRAAARDIERAQISTIHGFCSGVLRAHAVTAGLDPGFSVLPTSTARALRQRAFDAALADALADVGGAPRADALDLAAAWGPDRLRDAILGVHDALRSQGQTAPRLPPCVPRRTVAEALQGLRMSTETFAGELRGARTGQPSLDAARAVLADCFALLEGASAPGREALAALRFERRVPELKTDACQEWADAVVRVGEALDDREACADHALLDELLCAFAAAYAAGKRSSSGLDYDDLELFTRDLLRDEPAVAQGYAERFERIMVDEFQDTNRLQLELIGHLDRANVFLVGDELQSIYGFRHADVSLFREQRVSHGARGQARVLATNWRSHHELLETINGAWGAAVHPGYVPLVAGRSGRPGDGPRTELLITAAAWDDPDVDPRLAAELAEGMPTGVKGSKLAEARAIARRVRTLVDAGQCSESDVVVLVRAATDLHVFERALEREGFATLAGGGRGYWLRQPVQDLTSYLGALVNPRDERALFGTLASPLCGLSSDGLAHVAAVAREGSRGAWQAVRSVVLARRLSAADAAALEAFLVRFAVERTAAPRYGLDELIERAVLQSGYDLHVLRLPGGRRRLANVHKLLRLAAEYEADHGRDVRGFIDHATAEVEADVREAEAPVELSGEPAIRLMTIHAAKGLEFGVVVVADLGRKGRAEARDLLVEDDRVGLRLVRLGRKPCGALAHAELAARANAAAAEEERRILHVAFTRAEERLVLSGVVPVGDDWPKAGTTACPLSWIGPRLGSGLLARLPEEPALTVDLDDGHGRVHVGVRLVAPETAPATLGLAAPPPPGAQLGLFTAEPYPAAAANGSSAGRSRSAGPEPAREAGGALFAAGLTRTLTDPAAGLEAPAGLPAFLAAPPPPVPTLSYSSLSAHARCGYRFYLERVLRLPASELASAVAAQAPAGLDPRARGSIAHLVLEELDFQRPEVPPVATLRAMGARFDADPTQAEAAEIAALLERFLAASPLIDRLRAARRVRVEAAWVVPPASPDAPLLNGFLDVLADEEDGGSLVVDWKTDRLGGEDPAAAVERSYATQQAVYALAVLTSGAPEVEVAHAFLERPEVVVAERFAQSDLPELQARVLARARPVLERSFPVSSEPHIGLCTGCPGRGGLCSHPLELTDRVLEAAASPPGDGTSRSA
ncbi:MAG: ATP-dependent nuclease, subunit A [uncultured Solirubrobacteraceae bacterium]|uniref:DNA 3'-5' helicase n=1 Tax=uncultured Solirubrobacteraceae bacterium TaxID=1162706 RepID=A0A6J4SAD6_9ACTN|nr:MAG: ATP-dependent nuclease, subunit A [uncultured Solirubrobacteraceae bacterium]